ncbi:MAG: hypothetical protein ACP5MU_04780 [Thermoplasmata archaeon]
MEEKENNKIVIELKITLPDMSKSMIQSMDHILNALEEILKAGRNLASSSVPEVKQKIKKIEVK